jgi:uncharacterized protein YkwD
MKIKLLCALLLATVVCIISSCSSESSEVATSSPNLQKVVNYSYNSIEVKTMELINAHRVSKGLNPLQNINHMSYKSEEHNNYMIANNVVNHNGFSARSENIMLTLGATSVSENIAYNYNTPEAVLNAWLASPGHKENIEGNFTHFGIAIKENPATGKKYYTNIFAKI